MFYFTKLTTINEIEKLYLYKLYFFISPCIFSFIACKLQTSFLVLGGFHFFMRTTNFFKILILNDWLGSFFNLMFFRELTRISRSWKINSLFSFHIVDSYKFVNWWFSKTIPTTITFISIKFIKLRDDLQSTRWSLSQFLLTNINFSKKIDCKQHLLRLVSIPIKENIISISICLLTMLNIWRARKFMTRNMDSCFFHHWNKCFISFTSTLYLLNINNFLLISSLANSIMLTIVSKISNCILNNPFLYMNISIICQWMQMMTKFTSIWYNDFLSYSFIIEIPCSWPMNEDTKWRLFNFGSNIEENMLWGFFSHIFFKIERNNPTHHKLFSKVKCKQRQFKKISRIIIHKII